MATDLENINFQTNNPSNALNTLTKTPQELVWFKNLNSIYTGATYKDSVISFCKFFNIRNSDDLKKVESIHIIEYRNSLKEAKMKKATINTRLSSLSSLFKHLIEKQEIKINNWLIINQLFINNVNGQLES